MKKKLLLFLLTLLSAESAFLQAGPYDGMGDRNIVPGSVIEKAFPGVHAALKKGEEVKWYHVLNVDPDASDEVIARRVKRLRASIHPDKHHEEWIPAVAGFVGQAAEKDVGGVVGSVSADNENSLSTRKMVLSLLPKKFLYSTAALAALSYALYRGTQTNWFKTRLKKLDTGIKTRSSAVHKSLHFAIPASAKTGNLVWHIAQIGGGLVLCVGAMPLGLLSVSEWVTPDFSREIGNDEIDTGVALFTKQEDGSYYQQPLPGLMAGMFPERSISEEELRAQFKVANQSKNVLKACLPLSAATFIVGCNNIASGVKGIKHLVSSKNKNQKSLVLE